MAKRIKKKEVNDFKNFLRFQGLTRSFSKFKKLPRSRREIEMSFSNFDGTFRRKKVLVVRRNNRTLFLDHRSLSIIAVSRRSVDSAIASIDKKKLVSSRGFRGEGASGGVSRSFDWDISVRDQSVLKFKNTRILEVKNPKTGGVRRLILSKVPVRSQGYAIAKCRMLGSGGWKVVEARSRRFNLKTKGQRQDAINDAIYHCSVIAGFTPLEVEVLDYWFEHWEG